MEQYKYEFVEFLIKQKALLFGDSYKLKSGRISPYFFNAGQFNTAGALSKLGKFYAAAIVSADIQYDILYGPAYKGIPIVSSVAIALFEYHQLDYPFCFNRKEKKAHGEGGDIVGSPLEGRVLLVDDVISAGTTLRESAQMISGYPAELAAVVTAMDREERGETNCSAMEEIRRNYQVPAISIIKLQDVIDYLQLQTPRYEKEIDAILSYQAVYGVPS